MNPRVLFAVAVAFVLGLLLGPQLLLPAGGQQPAVGKVGKYQVSITSTANGVYSVVCDTETGQLLVNRGNRWQESAPPVRKQ
jgi:hypothetical protein